MQAAVQRQRLHGIAERLQRLAELCDSGGVGASARPSGEADVELAADAQHVPALEAGRVGETPHLEMPGERCGDGFDLAATRGGPGARHDRDLRTSNAVSLTKTASA